MVPLIGLALGLAVLQPPSPPGKLDVAAAISALETQPVYRAPGAVADVDVAAVTREMKPNMRLVIAPFATNDWQYVDNVYKPLQKWGDSKGIRVITVTGLLGWRQPPGVTQLRQQTAYMDLTGPTLSWIREEAKAPIGEAWPSYRVIPPTADQVADLAEKLRRDPVHNAEGLTDRVTRSYGSTRVVVLPPLKAGEPFVDYAPALAKEFPDDIVLVAQGYWVEVAGEDQDRLVAARNYVYAESERGFMFEGSTVGSRVDRVLSRIAELNHRKPFGAPPAAPRGLAQRIADYAPGVMGGAAVILGAGALASALTRRRRRRRADEAALRMAKATAYARITELAAALDLITRPDAADQYARARDHFAQGRVAEAERAAEKGLALL
ncbi:hypothetical protein [Actinosynnema sp. ALI-1.44]|uniref:hypothetical protein n=1 Tax=Actinosynnema sp. ALI-1.44 TaxID=1933779 RepID=UPI001177F3B8|nr:hypothetical protein [Actinosynnema sp. ALI-1.44]